MRDKAGSTYYGHTYYCDTYYGNTYYDDTKTWRYLPSRSPTRAAPAAQSRSPRPGCDAAVAHAARAERPPALPPARPGGAGGAKAPDPSAQLRQWRDRRRPAGLWQPAGQPAGWPVAGLGLGLGASLAHLGAAEAAVDDLPDRDARVLGDRAVDPRVAVLVLEPRTPVAVVQRDLQSTEAIHLTRRAGGQLSRLGDGPIQAATRNGARCRAHV